MAERIPVLMKCGCVAASVCSARGGVKYDPPIPSCLIHDCFDVAEEKPDLSGRMAKCSYSHANPSGRQSVAASPVPSSFDLAFFEYCGPGSREATEKCVCGYLKIAHDNNGGKCPDRPLSKQRPPSRTFTPQGPREFDRFYCGCFGWD